MKTRHGYIEERTGIDRVKEVFWIIMVVGLFAVMFWFMPL